MQKGKGVGKRIFAVAILTAAAVAAMAMASCGGAASEPSRPAGDAVKLPPGTTPEMLTETTGSGDLALEGGEGAAGEEKAGETSTPHAPSPGASAELGGARVTVVAATRPGSNAVVVTGSQREVAGDYLEIELRVENVGDDLVDLSEFSFRLWSPGIAADQYEDYYGANGPFGAYVSENMISAVLLDYATLQPASYKLKMGESLDGVFLFYDLNPKSAARNRGVTKEGTNLVVRKTRGEDAGEEVEINLAGYAD